AEPNAAGPDHRDPFVVGQPGPAGERPVRGGEPASQRGRGRDVDAVRDRDQVGVGGVQRDVFGERAPVGEAWLTLIRADLRVSGDAPRARTTAADERDGHAVPDLPSMDVATHLRDHAGKLVTGDVWKRDLLVSGPGMPVATTQPGRDHPDDDATV